MKQYNELDIPTIGSLFKMQGKLWKVKTDGDNGYVGVECQDHNRAFTVLSVEELLTYKFIKDETKTN